ncbi:Eco57I restriction-modification methylase [Caballeronia arationis]|uniref:Eco57I restriction-modification methylase domain-containing protein n=1 Tax=Caballeronia arationis TaxID=1777142 RepID=UPI00074CD794|nr:hypothetical protein [Caballeronia arationis]SAL04028.1 Eco57I restriction-modification methylase [Caballeronia arationis]
MNNNIDWWSSLNHGGLLIAPDKIATVFAAELSSLPMWQVDKLRRALTAFDGTNERLGALLDFMLQELSTLPDGEWQKAQDVDARWALRSFTGAMIKPRRIWQGLHGDVLPVFVPDDGASRQFAGRLGVGRSRQLLSRVVEWLRQKQQHLALVTNGRQWRLVHAGQDYEAWCEWDIDLWFVEGLPGPQVTAWRHLLSRDSMAAPTAKGEGALLSAVLASRKGQADLSAVLGERVRQAVEELITASHSVIEHAQLSGTAPAFADLYVAGSRIVMRCIITLFAEARNLLPVDNPIYQRAYSLEGLRQSLDRRASGRGNERLAQGRSAWPRLMALFGLVYYGSSHEALPVPQYSGGLFEPGDPHSQDGISRALALLESPSNGITDRQVQHMLRLLTRTRLRVRQGHKNTLVDAPVDFSALSSEYIGILYEGLLDFELKQAAADDPVVFLAVGNEPALTLSQLEAMDDAVIKQLFEALKKKDKVAVGEAEGEEPEDPEAPDDLEEAGAAADTPDTETETETEVADEDDELAISADYLARTQTWLEKAAVLAGLVKRSRGRKLAGSADDTEALAKVAKQLCARLVAPGQFFLVRWGGTRKGAGTFYTRPQLAAPTVRRTLQPLAYDAVRTEIDERTGLDTVAEWLPKRPEAILSLKVCDCAMGSGSFLAGALRYLTDALVASLHHHKLIERAENGGVPRMADGQVSELLSDEMLKLNPAHEGFEDALRAQLKRHIVERCLYGVDLDPLAVELGRMALWVETMDRDLPFGFLDHKLKVGNSLVGAWFDTYRDYPAMAWAREGGDKDYQKDKPGNLVNHFHVNAKGKKIGDKFTTAINARAKAVPDQIQTQITGQLNLGPALEASHVHNELLKVFRALHRLPVHDSDKRAAMYRDKVLNNPHFHALKARMDLWCALWFWPGEQVDLAPLPFDFAKPNEDALVLARDVAQQKRFFHWELEFPDVFTAGRPGFDAMLGNPPWEIQKPNSKEFFSNHDPLYRAYGKQDALAMQLDYFRILPELEHQWVAYNAGIKGMSNWVKFVGQPFGDRVTTDKYGNSKHDLNLGGRGQNGFTESARLHKTWQQQRSKRKGFADAVHPFVHQGSADLNTYKMFLELSHALLRPQGRMGMIVPSGIYTDKGTTNLRGLFLDHCDWQWLFGFENREGIFDIHRSFKFCPLIVQKGGTTQAIRAAFMHRNVDHWANAERHVLAYPRERVLEFSPYTKAIVEIRSEEELRVLQKIYAHGVLLGDQSERGWSVKYAREFDMTTDSKLFPPRPKWEEQGYQPDEYGHWLKGPWLAFSGPKNILDRDPRVVLSRDGSLALYVDQIEGVALPLYEGRMVGQFDFSEKAWVSGKGRKAVWEDISFENKVLMPQYLMSQADYRGADEEESEIMPGLKVGFLAIGSATNSRSMFAGLVADFPAGNSVAVLQCSTPQKSVSLMAALNSFAYDFTLRNRLGGLNLNYFVVAETATPALSAEGLRRVSEIGMRLGLPDRAFAEYWLGYRSKSKSWFRYLALTEHERARLKAINEAVCAWYFGLEWGDFLTVLEGCDLPQDRLSGGNSKHLNPKGFWRIDKDMPPELRHPVLSLVAFHDLKSKGLDDFLAQNAGEGWMLPEHVRLADYGLGHDPRAGELQPVAARMGPRFLEWQLNEDIERSWEECAAHAELIRRIVPLQHPTDDIGSKELLAAEDAATYKQGGLF